MEYEIIGFGGCSRRRALESAIFFSAHKKIPFGSNRSATAYMLDPLPRARRSLRLDRFIWQRRWSSNHRPEQWSISAGTRRASPSFLHGVPLVSCLRSCGCGQDSRKLRSAENPKTKATRLLNLGRISFTLLTVSGSIRTFWKCLTIGTSMFF